jgi:hypothetical protein
MMNSGGLSQSQAFPARPAGGHLNGPAPNAFPAKEQKRCLFEFTCLCGHTCELQSEMKDHYFKCERMKKHYGDLFNLIVKYNSKDLDIKQKQSLNSIIDMFSNEIQNNIA